MKPYEGGDPTLPKHIALLENKTLEDTNFE